MQYEYDVFGVTILYYTILYYTTLLKFLWRRYRESVQQMWLIQLTTTLNTAYRWRCITCVQNWHVKDYAHISTSVTTWLPAK